MLVKIKIYMRDGTIIKAKAEDNLAKAIAGEWTLNHDNNSHIINEILRPHWDIDVSFRAVDAYAITINELP